MPVLHRLQLTHLYRLKASYQFGLVLHKYPDLQLTPDWP